MDRHRGIFGPGFCVTDEAGRLLTSVHNQNLLRRARMLAEQRNMLAWEVVVEGLLALRARSETITRRDYDLAVRREVLGRDSDSLRDLLLAEGSLT